MGKCLCTLKNVLYTENEASLKQTHKPPKLIIKLIQSTPLLRAVYKVNDNISTRQQKKYKLQSHLLASPTTTVLPLISLAIFKTPGTLFISSCKLLHFNLLNER